MFDEYREAQPCISGFVLRSDLLLWSRWRRGVLAPTSCAAAVVSGELARILTGVAATLVVSFVYHVVAALFSSGAKLTT